MKSTKHFLSAAISIALALAFFACTSGGGGGNNASYTCKLSNGNCIETTSVSDCSQAGGSVVDVCQGQNGLSSSSNGNNGGGGSCEIKDYRTVKIGDQTWMAENLNCNVSGSVCYNNNQSNCAKYGRLYNWATAMAFPSYCNSSSCSNQVKAKHQGICPSGWHIPSREEWETLINFVGGENTAGIRLKAASGWNNGNGTDDYGFSALPGGSYDSGYGNFSAVVSYGYWWSASEDDAGFAYLRYIYYYTDSADWLNNSKSFGFSVRCIQD